MAGRNEKNLPLWNLPWILGPKIDGLGGRKEFACDFWLEGDLLVSRTVGENGLRWEVVLDEKKSGDRIELAAVDDYIIIQTYQPYLGLTFSRGLGNLLRIHANASDIVSVAMNRDLSLVEPGDPTTVSDLLSEGRNIMLMIDFSDGEPALSYAEGTRRLGTLRQFPIRQDVDEAGKVGRVKGKLEWNGDLFLFNGRVGCEIDQALIEFYYLTGRSDDDPKGTKKTKVGAVSRRMSNVGDLDRLVREGKPTAAELLTMLEEVFPGLG